MAMSVVPSSEAAGGGEPAFPLGGGGGLDVFGAAKAVAKADAVVKHEDTDDPLAAQAEEPVPAEWAWMLLYRAKMEAYCARLALYAVFIVLFTVVFQSIRPVGSTFAVQDALLEQTVRKPIPGAGVQGFHDISSDAAWFRWVEDQLLPTILSETYFNGDPRNASWGRRFVNTVAMYNTQTAAVRFRQARVTDDSCSTSSSSSTLARPCWGDFSADHQFRQAFGENYGNRYLTELQAIGAGGLHSYGTEAHVVDVPLVLSTAQSTLQGMRQGLWLNEQTRVMAVETSWYNANLDLSTYCRWQVDISPGGRFTPSVVIYSCRLSPYSTTFDKIRLVAEVLFCFILLYFIVESVNDIRVNKEAYFMSVWNWFELISLILYIVIVIWWLAYLGKDKRPFEVVGTGLYSDRPDLSKVANHYDALANLAGFNIMFSYIKVFKYLQIFPALSLFWCTLKSAARDVWPFLVVFLSFTCGFAFAGHWMFGLRLIEFHTWTRSFLTLFLTMVAGFPYDDMKRVAPLGGVLFAAAWVLVMVMVLANMFVAILTEWYRTEEEAQQSVATKLEEKIGNMRIGRPFYDAFCTLRSFLGGSEVAAAGYQQHSEEVRRLLRQADLRSIQQVREAVAQGRPLLTRELRDSFRGDLDLACSFAREVQQIAIVEPIGKARRESAREIEGREREELLQLQGTVERLEDHLRLLRGALHDSSVARLGDDDLNLGSHIQVMPARSGTTNTLPGSIPEQ